MASEEKLFISGLLFKEKKGWTALNLEFDIASQGNTPEEAADNNLEAVELYIETCLKEGKNLEEIYRLVPLRYRLLYVWLTFIHNIRGPRLKVPRYFSRPLKLHPA